MNLYSKKQRWKIVLLVIALVIVSLSIWYVSYISNKIRQDEKERVNNWGITIRKKAELVNIMNQSFQAIAENDRAKVKLWADATLEMEKDYNDYGFLLKVIKNNDDFPLILTDNGVYSSSKNLSDEQKHPDSIAKYMEEWSVENPPITISYAAGKTQQIFYRYSDTYYQLQDSVEKQIRNFNSDLVENKDLVPVLFIDESDNIIATNLPEKITAEPEKLKKELKLMASENVPITLELGDGVQGTLYYRESTTVKQLKFYPYVMMAIISLFALVAYLLFSTFRRAEQNQVWVGMAKETAHQLGTPITSLMGWLEILKTENVPDDYIKEMNKDLLRLQTVTERFSKIGSENKLHKTSLKEMLLSATNYLQKRVSEKVEITTDIEGNPEAMLNEPLFNWVIENLIKNAVDAMEGKGKIHLKTTTQNSQHIIEISDTGKGIPSNKLKAVFEPGFTTKKRGWGLGLSLAKRIVEEHHKGKIYVSQSSPEGTTFKILLEDASTKKDQN